MSMSARPDGEIGPRAMVFPVRRPAGNLPGRPGQVRGIAGPGTGRLILEIRLSALGHLALWREQNDSY